MATTMSDVILHIDEETTHDERESLRDYLLEKSGVLTADCRDTTPHLMIVGFDPEGISARELLSSVHRQGYNAELVSML